MASHVTSEDILEWLRKKELRYNFNESDRRIAITLSGKNTQLEALVRREPNFDFIGCRVHYPLKVPENKRIEVCELITRINHGFPFPSCTMSMSTGEVCCQTYVLIAGADFHADQFGQAFYRALESADWWFPAFMAVIDGQQTPEQAVEQISAGFHPSREGMS